MLMYNLEDTFIERDVIREGQYLSTDYASKHKWSTPRNNYMTLYFSIDSLPDEIKPQFIDEPQRREFYGEAGRHYHIYVLPDHQQVYLVAQVSQMLVVRPMRDSVLKFMLICGLLLVLLAFFIAWRLGRNTANPLQALADLVDGVAPENIPDKFAHQFPNNEIGILARTLESSLQRIRQALEREKCFTRDVSHELRTPVTIIKNSLEVYQSKTLAAEAANQVINRIADASLQMEQTVTTLLALAREEQTLIAKAQVKLLAIAEQSILDNSHLLKDKQIEVQVSDNCQCEILVHQGMLKILLDNLLSNAFQHIQAGIVRIDFIQNQLVVADTGPGIEKNIAGKISEPAIKGSQSSGYGFGLSIVKRLCEHQGWTLSVSSNQGTAVAVQFNQQP